MSVSENARVHSGWSEEETNTLFAEAKTAGLEGRPIKSVFDKVALLTGRKPNSIRNYYYLKLRENEEFGRTKFVPFTDEEAHTLMRTILLEQGKGRSVRSIAMELGGGDKKAMLRYQNKYRSILRNDTVYVAKLVQELREEGLEPFDPTSGERRRRVIATRRDAAAGARELAALATSIGGGGQLIESVCDMLRAVERAQSSGELAAQLAEQLAENAELQKRLSTLESINRRFMQLSQMERMETISEYAEAVGRALGD